jgi:hypothetical protein
MVDLHLEDLNAGLLHSQVGHLNVEAVEVDTFNALVDSASKAGLTDFLNADIVRDGAVLMELAEKNVEINNRARVLHVPGPPGVVSHGAVSCLERVDDLREVPGEGEHVGVLLLVKLLVNAETSPLGFGGLDLALLVCVADN